MEISARNQLPGRIVKINVDGVMAEVTVEVQASTVVAAITRGSFEHLGLKDGDTVTVVIKATEVIIGK